MSWSGVSHECEATGSNRQAQQCGLYDPSLNYVYIQLTSLISAVYAGRLDDADVIDLVESLPFLTLIHQSVAGGSNPRSTGFLPAISAIVDCLARKEVREAWMRGLVRAVEGSSRVETACSVRAVLTILGMIYTATEVSESHWLR